MAETLFQKVWDLHSVRRLPNGQTQLYIGLASGARGHEPAGV